jgi:hypothetical protein
MNNSFTDNLDYETTSDDNTSEENKDLVKITKPKVNNEIKIEPKKPTNISSIKVSNPTLLLLKANKK